MIYQAKQGHEVIVTLIRVMYKAPSDFIVSKKERHGKVLRLLSPNQGHRSRNLFFSRYTTKQNV